MPSIQRDLMGRMTDLESRAAEQVSGLSTKLGGRVSQCESDMRTKVDRADFQKLAIEVDDRARIEEAEKLRTFTNEVRNEVSVRIDDIADRNMKMRRELDSSLASIQAVSEAVTRQVEER